MNFNWYIHIDGVAGNIDEIELNSEASIVRAGFQIAKFFSINYSRNDAFSEVAVFEEDYLLKLNVQIPKQYYNYKTSSIVRKMEQTLLGKWKTLVYLSLPGYLKFGKEIKLSADWPIIFGRASGPYGNETLFNYDKDLNTFTNESILNLQEAVKTSYEINYEKELDKKIVYAIERLKKSKSTTNIDDRVVELSIALEFLINTTNIDVTLQLCLKLIKLLYEPNTDELIFAKLKRFYSLRSVIIHGNDKLKADEPNKDLVNFTESLIQKAILKLMELNQIFEYKAIDSALAQSLHVSKSVMSILQEKNKL